MVAMGTLYIMFAQKYCCSGRASMAVRTKVPEHYGGALVIRPIHDVPKSTKVPESLSLWLIVLCSVFFGFSTGFTVCSCGLFLCPVASCKSDTWGPRSTGRCTAVENLGIQKRNLPGGIIVIRGC